MAPVIADIRAAGYTGLRAIGVEFNRPGMLTRTGGRWHVSNASNLLRRVDRGQQVRGGG